MNAPLLQIVDLAVSFDGIRVLDGLSMSVAAGEMRFLIGPNGAGKTTLLDVITGKVPPSRGQVIFDGHPQTCQHSIHARVRRGIGRKFQSPAVFAGLTVRENLEVAVGGIRSIRALFGRCGSIERERIDEILDNIALGAKQRQLAGALSHGEKQWLEIGMLLLGEPKLLLLDEPVAGMTRAERDRTGQLLQRIGQDRAVLVVEHDMHFVRQFSATVTVLHAGRVLVEGPMALVGADERVIDVYLGRKSRNAVPPATALAASGGKGEGCSR